MERKRDGEMQKKRVKKRRGIERERESNGVRERGGERETESDGESSSWVLDLIFH